MLQESMWAWPYWPQPPHLCSSCLCSAGALAGSFQAVVPGYLQEQRGWCHSARYCRLGMAFSRQVFPVSGSARQSWGQSRHCRGFSGNPQQPAATFRLAVHEMLLALL